jgi:hypothetical protein
VIYYDATGDIYGSQTLKIMLDWIDRADRFEFRGQMSVYLDQLYAFANQAQDFETDQMSQVAADVLAEEALLLISFY